MEHPPSQPGTSGQSRFGRYKLVELIGRGGMAEVYKAVAHGLEGFRRVFVIKRILKDKSASKDFVEMFVNEARISALLNHSNIVQIYDFGQIDGSYFLAMEYLRGKDLLTVMRALRSQGKQMPPEVAGLIAQQVANALQYAHNLTQGGKSLDIVHRDISPSNVMLLRAGGIKLLDFGIAKAAMQIKGGAHDTQVGLVKGKLSYAAPEQIQGEPVDRRADIFSLGVVLWEALTGKRLFYDKSDYQTMKNVLERPVPPPSTQRPDVPPPLDFIVVRALERDPERRYPNAKMMADELNTFLEEMRIGPSAIANLLDDLFGEDAAQDVPLAGQSGQYPVVEAALAAATGTTPPAAPAEPSARKDANGSLLGLAPSTGSGYAVATSVILGRGSKGRRRALGLAAGAAIALAGLAITIVGVGRGKAQAPAVVAKPEAPPVASTVVITIASDPSGAEVTDKEGASLGITPLNLTVPRSGRALLVAVSKPGFETSRQSLIPDRDVAALLTLRAVAEPVPALAAKTAPPAAAPALTAKTAAPAPAARAVARGKPSRAPVPARGAPPPKAEAPASAPAEAAATAPAPVAAPEQPAPPAASDGKVKEGLSVDPFAEDPAAASP